MFPLFLATTLLSLRHEIRNYEIRLCDWLIKVNKCFVCLWQSSLTRLTFCYWHSNKCAEDDIWPPHKFDKILHTRQCQHKFPLPSPKTQTKNFPKKRTILHRINPEEIPCEQWPSRPSLIIMFYQAEHETIWNDRKLKKGCLGFLPRGESNWKVTYYCEILT